MRINFIGDVFPGDETFTAGFGVRSATTPGIASVWARNIAQAAGQADYIVGNLEAPLVDAPEGEIFCGHPFFADILKSAGVNVLNIANNHIMERGLEGFEHTVFELQSRRLAVTGLVKDGVPVPVTLQKGDTSVCMAAFCDESVCSLDNPGCYASLDETLVMETLGRMKAAGADVLVFIFHWGREYVHIPSPSQRRIARMLIDGGANLVVGHHPHVIQPYERYKDGHILYSLGNFCFDDIQSAHFGRGMTASVEIEGGAIREVSLSGVSLQDMAYSDSLVQKMPEEEFKRHFTAVQEGYQSLQEMPESSYESEFERLSRRAHRREKLQMRLDLICKLMDVTHRHKKLLLRNVRRFILK